MATVSNQNGKKLCMGYLFGFCYPDCNHCEYFNTCFPENREHNVSSRDLEEQSSLLSNSEKELNDKVIILPKAVSTLYRLFT